MPQDLIKAWSDGAPSSGPCIMVLMLAHGTVIGWAYGHTLAELHRKASRHAGHNGLRRWIAEQRGVYPMPGRYDVRRDGADYMILVTAE